QTEKWGQRGGGGSGHEALLLVLAEAVIKLAKADSQLRRGGAAVAAVFLEDGQDVSLFHFLQRHATGGIAVGLGRRAWRGELHRLLVRGRQIGLHHLEPPADGAGEHLPQAKLVLHDQHVPGLGRGTQQRLLLVLHQFVSDTATAGSSTVKRLPCPTPWLSARIRPPWFSTIA